MNETKEAYFRFFGLQEKEFDIKPDSYNKEFYKNYKQVMVGGLMKGKSIVALFRKKDMSEVINQLTFHHHILIQYDVNEPFILRIRGGFNKPFEIELPLPEAEVDMLLEQDI